MLASSVGPSPRARGSRGPRGGRIAPGRSIPACAGLTPPPSTRARPSPVHPRVRGAHGSQSGSSSWRVGPSPRARGSRHRHLIHHPGRRSIPACAGLTDIDAHPRGQPRSIPACAGLTQLLLVERFADPVHPRVRGAHFSERPFSDMPIGPSPRARGSPFVKRPDWSMGRSIPACAGLTRRPRDADPPTPVHPRVRGAHILRSALNGTSSGPSPRARGSQAVEDSGDASRRSIPACAGLTEAPTVPPFMSPVHPRVRGAHRELMKTAAPRGGPSPRARGSHVLFERDEDALRSIPACAGLTWTRCGCTPKRTVHPRVRGAHAPPGVPARRRSGPSPRARGSLRRWSALPSRLRSIPACAGLSSGCPERHGRRAVHPRVRGALAVVIPGEGHYYGPSPRARGSPAGPGSPKTSRRSIPACAGLSPTPNPRPRPTTVHPRVRGALDSYGDVVQPGAGPSPRARGSPEWTYEAMANLRSIPACAGLSGPCGPAGPWGPVHPRVRGALSAATHEKSAAPGPSPRARGSLSGAARRTVATRSIPACAGLSVSTGPF